MTAVVVIVALVLWGLAVAFIVTLVLLADLRQSLWNRLKLYRSERDRKFRRIDEAIRRHEDALLTTRIPADGSGWHDQGCTVHKVLAAAGSAAAWGTVPSDARSVSRDSGEGAHCRRRYARLPPGFSSLRPLSSSCSGRLPASNRNVWRTISAGGGGVLTFFSWAATSCWIQSGGPVNRHARRERHGILRAVPCSYERREVG
jgi:hypothetical protein